jgi:hypothetical protein
MKDHDYLNIDRASLRYRVMIGTGGIGSGSFFELNGNHTLGREESRSGHFIDRKDYCKLHIVSHYVQVLLGPGFRTLPIGCVGDDHTGRTLYREMEEAGLDLTYVTVDPGAQTLFSFCYLYPDGSGGNLTTEDSASSKVVPSSMDSVEEAFRRYEKIGIGLAVPEVPMEARFRLLELSTRYAFFRVASFTAGELRQIRNTDIFERQFMNWRDVTRSSH